MVNVGMFNFQPWFADRLLITNSKKSCHVEILKYLCNTLKYLCTRYVTVEYSRFTDYENDWSNYWENRVSRREIAIFPRNTEGMIVCRSLLRVFVNKNLHGDSVRLSSTVRVRRIAFFIFRSEIRIFSFGNNFLLLIQNAWGQKRRR